MLGGITFGQDYPAGFPIYGGAADPIHYLAPPERVLSVPMEQRHLRVAMEDRRAHVPQEGRALKVSREERRLQVPAEQRRMKVKE